MNLHRLAFHSQLFWCQPSSSKTSFAERNHRGLENPKQKGATRREQERVDTVKGVFSRSFRELTAVFHWLSGFTSKRRSGWRSLAEDHCTSLPPVCNASYSLHRTLRTLSDSVLTTLREEATDGITLFLQMRRQTRRLTCPEPYNGAAPQPRSSDSAHPLTCHTDPTVGATGASRAVYGLFLWKAAWSRSSPFAFFLFFLAQNVQHSAHQLLNRVANHRCLLPIIVFK